MREILSSSAIEKHKSNPEIIALLVLQIQKDLGQFGYAFVPEEEHPGYQQLINLMMPIIDELINHHFDRFLNLLYRIDVPEKTLTRAELKYPDMNKAELVCHLILEKELKKVLFRLYYSNKDKLKE